MWLHRTGQAARRHGPSVNDVRTLSSAAQRLVRKDSADVVITYAKRSAFTKAKKGSFRDTSSDSLLYSMLKTALPQMGVPAESVDDIVVGTCHPPSPCYEARAASLAAGFPERTGVQTINRLCGSGLMAVQSISNSIARGDIRIGLAVGYESMSSHPRPTPVFSHPAVLGHAAAADCAKPMGWTSEMLASKYGVSRGKQDEYGLLSHNRAERAQKAGVFDREIVPLHTFVKDRETGEVTPITVMKDDGIRLGATMESMKKGKSAFPDWGDGRSTGANSSQVTDGAAVALLMRRSKAEELGLSVLAKHINEAFGSMYAHCVETLGLNIEQVNVNGGAIALGHPLGATGIRQIVTGLNSLMGKSAKFLISEL